MALRIAKVERCRQVPCSPSWRLTVPRATSVSSGVIGLALVLVVIAVWALGGFERRTDLLRTIPPGTLFTTGPYELQFTEATAQPKERYDGQRVWEISMIGVGRTTGDISIAPSLSGNGMFVSKDDVTGETPEPERLIFGDVEDRSQRRSFAPGLPPAPFRVVFEYPENYRPGPTIRFAVSELVYSNRYLVGGEEEWHNGTYSHHFYLPVRELPPDAP